MDQLVNDSLVDPLHWLQTYTKTENPHWQDEGKTGPHEAFPQKDYYRAVFEVFEHEPVTFVEKSRDLMLSWCCVAFFLNNAMRYPSRQIVFQTKKEDDVIQLVDYAKILYDQQPQWLKEACPLPKPVWSQPQLEFDLGRGSVIIGIPGGGDQIRSKHPWGALLDEACFQPEAGECYANAVNAGTQKIIVNSSVAPGWMSDFVRDTFTLADGEVAAGPSTTFFPPVRPTASQYDHTVDRDYVRKVLDLEVPPQTPVELTHGLTFRRTKQGTAVIRVHYCCDAERCTHVNPDKEWYKREFAKTNSRPTWDREQEIVHEAGGGDLVFADVFREHWDKIVISDPDWMPSPHWKQLGGMDHGKSNPTAFETAYIDYDGTIIFCGEYYSPGPLISAHAEGMTELPGWERIAPALADPSIFPDTVATKDGYTSINAIYREHGIKKFVPFEGDRSDVGFVDRLLEHWRDLDNREPTVKIVCRKPTDRPIYGTHKWDCPNLLWELKRSRRVQLSAAQLQTRNLPEAIVDKDNHARDCSKHIVMSLPRPSQRPVHEVIEEKTRNLDPTSKAIAIERLTKAANRPRGGAVLMSRKASRMRRR